MRFIFPMLLMSLAVGCAKQSTTLQPEAAQPSVDKAEPANPAEEIRQIEQPIADLTQLSTTLSAVERDEYRREMTEVFVRYNTILPVLIGPEPGGAFRQQLAIVDATRAQLAGTSENMALQPTIDSGLRAVLNALSGVYRDQFFENADIATALDALRSRVDELDAAPQGATRRLVVGQVVAQSAGVMKQMSNQFSRRAGTTVPTTNTTTTTPVAAR